MMAQKEFDEEWWDILWEITQDLLAGDNPSKVL